MTRAESYFDLHECRLCPRTCGADRSEEHLGYCRVDHGLAISSVCTHRGEEPVLSGRHGICNIFFAHCNLQCIYCQNYQISANRTPCTSFHVELPDVLRQIERILDTGAIAVGFVSPSHCVPQMLEIMDGLEKGGRRPIYVYNTNGYDRAEVIGSIGDRIDVYLPDFKYMDDGLAMMYSDVPDYVSVASEALGEMYRQKGADIVVNDNGLITSGMIIRHLVLPGHAENSKAVLRFIAEQLSPDLHISLMAQYYPNPAVADHPVLGRLLTQAEYDSVLSEFESLGFHRGWVQSITSPSEYLPDFSKDHPFEG